MSKSMKFLDNGANLTTKGLVKDRVYEISDPKESQKYPGRTLYVVAGGGLTAGVTMFAETLAAEFVDIATAQPIQQTLNMAATTIQAPPVTKPVPSGNGVPQNVPAGVPIKVTAETILAEFKMFETKMDDKLARIESKIANQSPIKVQPATEAQDLFLSELVKLNYDFFTIKVVKSPTVTSMTIIADGVAPLSINAKDISAKQVVSAMTEALSETSLINASIKDYKARITELLAAKEAEAKAAAKPAPVKTEASAANTADKAKRKSAAEKAAAGKPVATPTAGSPFVDDEPDLDEPDDDSLEADFTEERAGNGLSAEVDEFQLV